MARQEARAAKLFLIPAFLGLTFITYLPLIAVFALSFFKWTAIMPRPLFVGLSNYIRLFTKDIFFWTSVKVTVQYAVLSVCAGMVYSLSIALLLSRKVPARGFFRAVFYVPYIIPAIAVYTSWALLYNPDFGVFNALLASQGLPRITFLADSRYIIPSLAVIAVWASGNLIVIFLAGLGNVPRVYHEAAEIDGASAWQRFCRITVPCMTPIIFYNLLMSLIANMQVVVPSLIYAGSNRTTYPEYTFMSFLMYRTGFINNDLSYASTISFIFFAVIGLFTLVLFVTSKSWLFYEGGDR
ncbi:MAG: sugar ABC transporter permease [Oscillospiraceae bacterium]|jgi:multiple sugar transport system permease protein|nr:sugar ABC transporter permease [Oscillospiraceae bacterium]